MKSMRSGDGGDNEVQRTMLQIVNQLDGYDARRNIKVLMATNRSNLLPTIPTPNIQRSIASSFVSSSHPDSSIRNRRCLLLLPDSLDPVPGDWLVRLRLVFPIYSLRHRYSKSIYKNNEL
ncbi:hypothetical protein PVK06_037030 [Gossypium arboreum]|uniref:ATPase AAA-type core domain-containing protein n=1 Tax=Gossypium arboreum TaxID=29729 RepID=A0ABR0MWC3_GOSAR|nr:hypothetical protein PVK06_037030 [Gossypium arboreum]